MPGPLGLDVAAFVISSATFAFTAIWAPFASHRAEQTKLGFELKRQYVLEYQPHLDTLHAYRAEHGKNHYYRHWRDSMRDGLPADNPEKRVDNARRLLREFWKEVFDYRKCGNLATAWACLPAAWGPQDILSGNFMRRAEDFQELVEPLDVVNWYRLQAGDPAKYKGEYMDERGKARDKCFREIDACRVQAGQQEKVTEWRNELSRVAERCRAAPERKAPAPVAPGQQECVADRT